MNENEIHRGRQAGRQADRQSTWSNRRSNRFHAVTGETRTNAFKAKHGRGCVLRASVRPLPRSPFLLKFKSPPTNYRKMEEEGWIEGEKKGGGKDGRREGAKDPSVLVVGDMKGRRSPSPCLASPRCQLLLVFQPGQVRMKRLSRSLSLHYTLPPSFPPTSSSIPRLP